MALGTPEFSTINRGTGSIENSLLIIKLLILGLLEFFGVEWSEMQIEECADIFYSEYYWLHWAEMKQFMLKVKSLNFGQMYGKFTPDKFLTYAGEYAAQSLTTRESVYQSKALEYKQEERWGSRIGSMKSSYQTDTQQDKEMQDRVFEFLNDFKNQLLAEKQPVVKPEETQVEPKKSITPDQYARQNGVDVSQFSYDAEIREVYEKVKAFKTGRKNIGVNLLAEHMYTSSERVISIGNFTIRGKEEREEFIKKGKIVISILEKDAVK